MRALEGFGMSPVFRESGVLASEGKRVVVGKPLQNPHALLKATDPDRSGVEQDDRPSILWWKGASRPDPELEPAAGEDIEGRRFLGDERGMAKVVLPDQRADPECGGRLGRDRQRGPIASWAPK